MNNIHCCSQKDLKERGPELLAHNIACREDVIAGQKREIARLTRELASSEAHLGHLQAALEAVS